MLAVVACGPSGTVTSPRIEVGGIEVVFTRSQPVPGYGIRAGSEVLAKGTRMHPDGRPLSADIVRERDICIQLRDGTTVYADLFRPLEEERVPVIIAWSPYGKSSGEEALNKLPGRGGVPVGATSGLQKFEGPDPAFWCGHGYAVLNPDSRGAFHSQGTIRYWGTQDAQDGYDVVEWAAAQPWCTGKVAFAGNSWLAIAQWFIAAEQPPHLAAIAPWEGLSDMYRHDLARGGVVDATFNARSVASMIGQGCTEDTAQMIQRYPLMNPYWQDKAANLERISVPAYIVASWTNGIHVRGTFEGWHRCGSPHKWLRVHNSHEWPDLYEHEHDLRRFFDHVLKGLDNGWEETPRVRLSILNPGGEDIVNRAECEFPLARTDEVKLYLDATDQTMARQASANAGSLSYGVGGQAAFEYVFPRDTELTGYFTLHAWVEAVGVQDIDLHVYLQKLDAGGMLLEPQVDGRPWQGARGWLRVSHREVDPERSLPWAVTYKHTREQYLCPGQVVPVDITLEPLGMVWRRGERLRLVVTDHDLGTSGGTRSHRNETARCRLHAGGRYDSYLLIPQIPRQAAAQQ